MNEIDFNAGIEKALDAIHANRLAMLCGAGLSMAAPSSLPSAAALAHKAKTKYDSTYGSARAPLASSIDEQAQFFFDRNELVTVYLRSYIDADAFASAHNVGHSATADLLLTGGIATAVTTNVDQLIEVAGNHLLGNVAGGISVKQVATLPPDRSPLLKIHGCWTDPASTVWASGQVAVDPIKDRLDESGKWLTVRLFDRDLIIVGYWTDWDYLNAALEKSIGKITPSRVIVVDPCETTSFETKAKALFELGMRASTGEFFHVRCSGADFLDRLRLEFSRSFVRRVLHAGKADTSRTPDQLPTRLGSNPALVARTSSGAFDETLRGASHMSLHGCGNHILMSHF